MSFLPDQLVVGAENEVRCTVYMNGSEVYASSATVTVVRAHRTVVVATMAAETPEGGSARAKLTIPSTTPFEEGGTVRWRLTFDDGIGEAHGSTVVDFENEAMFVRVRPVCPISIEHVWMVAPALQPGIPGGAVTTMGAQQQEGMLEMAWIEVEQRLLTYGRRPFLVIGSSALVEVTRLTVLAKLFAALGHRLNEAHTATAESYRLQAEEAWKRVRVAYDETQIGGGSGPRVSARRAGTFVGRGAR